MKSVIESWSRFLIALPIFLVVWILYQFINLSSIDRIIFFSWSQVISDTVILFVPTLLGLLWFWLWTLINPYGTFRTFCESAIFPVIVVILLGTLFWWFEIPFFMKQSFLYAAAIGIFLPVFTYVQIKTWSEKMKDKNHVFVLKILAFVMMFILLFKQFWISQYQNLYVNVDNKPEGIIYMNDNYIFTKDRVIHNADSVVFNYK